MRRSLFASILAAALIPVLGVACGNGGGGTDLPPPGPTTGTVTATVQADGAGVEGATVALSGVGSATTNADGVATFFDVAAGGYTATLTVPEGLELAEGETASKPVTVVAGQTATVQWSVFDPDPPVIFEIRMSGVTFSPQDASITVGTRVRWIVDEGAHTITPENPDQPGVWSDVAVAQGDTFEHTFEVAGETYDYICVPHVADGMVGSITVTAN